MKLIALLFLPLVSGLILDECVDHTYKNMDFHVCNNLKEYKHEYFHDVTGENRVRLVNNKLYRNHGVYTAMFKDNLLYIGKVAYTDDEWVEAFENVSV